MSSLPDKVNSWLGQAVVKLAPVLVAEQGLWLNFCVAVQDPNPMYWAGMEHHSPGPVAPPAMLPSWMIDHEWSPDQGRSPLRTLELHFMLKDELNLPYGVVTGVEMEFHKPVRSGDRLRADQVLLEVGEEYLTRMGTGRRWAIAVYYYHEDDELAGIQTLRFVSYRKDSN